MDSIFIYADADIEEAIEKATLDSGEFTVLKKADINSDSLALATHTGASIMILQVKNHIYHIENLLYDLDAVATKPLLLIFEVRGNGKVCYTTTNQTVCPRIRTAARLFEDAILGMYECHFSYFRTTVWSDDAPAYTEAASRSDAVMEILRGCTAEECRIHKNRYGLDLKEKGYYLYFYELQSSEYRDHMINKDVYNFIGDIIKRRCGDIISAYNGGEIIYITLDFLCVIINDLNIRSEAKKNTQFTEMIHELLETTGCKTGNRYLSSRFEKMTDLRRGYDQYRADKSNFFFQRDETIMRASHSGPQKQPTDMEQVFKLLQEIKNILYYDLSNPDLKNIMHSLYFDILKPSFNFTLFYYCTAVICSDMSRVQGALDDSLIRKNLNPNLFQFSSIEEQYESMLRRIHDLQVTHIVRRQTRNSLALKALEYIAQNYGREITVSDIADYLYISNVYLNRIFRSQLGVSVTHYIILYRMEEAQKLLKDTDDLIYNIAEKVGYHDSRHFSKTFKKIVGSSPGKFRNRERKQRNAIWLSGGYNEAFSQN